MTTIHTNSRDNSLRKRVGKTLSYILRYGAAKEGLHVTEGGFVSFDNLLDCPILKGYRKEFLLDVIVNDTSYRGVKRFERKGDGVYETVMVRAAYGRRLEENPNHQNCHVKKLSEICMDHLVKHIKYFDFLDFTDDYIVSILIQRLRKEKALNNVTLQCVLPASLEILDVEGCYLTPKSLEILRTRCPRLRVLNLRCHGYLLTDQNLKRMLQGLPQMETLNLTCNHNLTDRSLDCIRTLCPELRHLNLFGVSGITDASLLQFLCLADKLVYLDIFDHKFETNLNLETAVDVARQRGIVLVHRDIKDLEVCPTGALTAHLGDRGRFW